jgi:hypothetical protein
MTLINQYNLIFVFVNQVNSTYTGPFADEYVCMIDRYEA